MIEEGDVDLILAKLQGLTGGRWEDLATSAWRGQIRQLQLAPAIVATEAIVESYDGRGKLTWAVWRMAYNAARMRAEEERRSEQPKQAIGPEEISLAEHIRRLKTKALLADREAIAELERWKKFARSDKATTSGWSAELSTL